MLQPGFWWGAHDARHSVYFLFEFDQAIRDGVLWPRWSPDFAFGYGYPFFNVYGPFSSYVGEAFHLLGFDLVTSVKLSFALSVLVSGLTMYGFARRLWGPNGGLLAAVAYVYFPYHLADVYVRAALAECWALAWFPAVFWGLFECVARPRPRAVALAAVAYALLFVSHNGLALPVTVALVGWVAFWLLAALWRASRTERRVAPLLRGLLPRAGAAAAAALLGITLAGIFVFPLLLEYQFVNTDQWSKGYFAFPQHFVEAWQLLSPRWGFGISQPGPEDSFPFQLGLAPLLLGAAAWVLPLRERRARLARFFFTLLLLALVGLMVEPSLPLWQSPLGDLLLKPMQFPWRFLVLAGLALAALAGAVGQHASRGATLLLALVLVVGSYDLVRAEIIEPAEGPVGFAALMRFQQSAGEMTGQSRWVALEDIPTWSPLADAWVAGQPVNSRFAFDEGLAAARPQSTSVQEIVEVKLDEPRTLRWMITYYPGWRAYRLALERDEILEELPITPAPGSAHITVEAPAGHYRYMVRFEDTPVRVVGKVASLLSLLVVAGLLLGRRRRP